MNDNASISTYIIASNDCYDLWYSRLGHISALYVKSMQNLGLILGIKFKDNNSKCHICAKTVTSRIWEHDWPRMHHLTF